MRITSFKSVSLFAVMGMSMAFLSTHAGATTIAHWRFEEGVAGSGATSSVLDSSGNGLHGTPLGGLTYTANTPGGTLPQTGDPNDLSLNFDGGGASRVFIADNPLFQLTESLTLEAYVNMSGPPSGRLAEILFRGDSRLGLDPYFLDIEANTLRFTVRDELGGQARVTATAPQLNQWVHIAAVLDDSTGAMGLYLDGILVDSIITNIRPFAVLNPSLNPGLSIGGYPATDYFGPFRGMIDEVRISDVALSPDQFLNAASAPVPEPATGVVLLMGVVGMALRKRMVN